MKFISCSMSAHRRASPYGNGRPVRWGTVSNGRVSNASRLPWTNGPPAVINPPGGTAVAGQGLPAAHSTSPRGDATHHASSSSSLVSLPVKRGSAPHPERYTRGHRESAFAIARDPANSRLPSTTSKRYAIPPQLWQDVGHDRTCGILSCSRRNLGTRQNLLLAWCSPSWRSYVEQVTGRPAPSLNKPCSRQGCTTNRFLHR